MSHHVPGNQATFAQPPTHYPKTNDRVSRDVVVGYALKLVTVKLPEGLIKGLDDLVKQGMYPSRSSAIRAAVRDMLKRELWHIEAQ